MYPISNVGNLTTTLLSGYSMMNNARASFALSGKSSAVTAVSPVKQTLSKEANEFLKTYQEKMTSLQTAANAVLNPKTADKLEAGSQNTGIATVSGKVANKNDTYSLTVQQLASGQVNRSQSFASNGTLPSMGGSLTIKSSAGTYNLNLSASGAKTNREALSNFADKINAAKTGMTAKVIDKDGGSHLELTGGEGQDFSVSGSFATRYGLDAAAVERKDAIFDISKNGGVAESYTSTTNVIEVDGLTAELQGVGSTGISAGKNDSEAKADAMQTLVDKFNETLKYLNKNADQGVGVLTQMKRMILPPTSEKSMDKIGLTINKDGTMNFDRKTFTQEMDKDSSFASSIMNNVARGIQNDARMGMKETSNNLLSTLKKSEQQTSFDLSSINLLSAYNRTGVYNAMNMYAVGALMNISV